MKRADGYAYLSAEFAGRVRKKAVVCFLCLLTVPALFVTAQWGELFALRLLSFFTHRPLSAPPPRRDNRVLAVVLLLFGAAAMELFVVPPVVEMLI